MEIIAKDMTARISQSPVMRLQLTNILNRPVKGRLAVALQGLRVSVPDTVTLAPHETRTIPVQITGAWPPPITPIPSPCILMPAQTGWPPTMKICT